MPTARTTQAARGVTARRCHGGSTRRCVNSATMGAPKSSASVATGPKMPIAGRYNLAQETAPALGENCGRVGKPSHISAYAELGS